ncbi:MAG: hypothetical protein LCH76_06225 [Actinobacteria bacterium]|nr:hypothetical protein [Actinomycetota bacterium]
MIIATPVTVDGRTAESWGKAHWVGVADVAGPRITSWTIHEVGWDDAKGLGKDSRHARIARFLQAEQVTTVVAPAIGRRLRKLFAQLGIGFAKAIPGDARTSVLAAASAIS